MAKTIHPDATGNPLRVLSRYIPAVVGHYHLCLEMPAPDTSKEFILWQKACRESLAHIDTLMRMIETGGGGGASADTVNDLILAARRSLGKDSVHGNNTPISHKSHETP